MKAKTRLLPLLAALLFVGLSAQAGLAHSKKEGTMPADGAVLEASPENLLITFDSPMRITMIRLTGTDGADHAFTRRDDMAPTTRYEAVPSPLPQGRYTVDWRGLSSDGHAMEGSFRFEVRP